MEILQRDNWMCQACVDTESTLHVHHIKYTSKLPWETPDNLLITLCESCHQKEEELKGFDFYSLLEDVTLTRKDLIIILQHIRFIMLHPNEEDTAFWVLNREVMSRLSPSDNASYHKYLRNGLQKIAREVEHG